MPQILAVHTCVFPQKKLKEKKKSVTLYITISHF